MAMPDGTVMASTAPRMIFNGSDMRSEIFRSAMKPDALLEWFKREWKGDWVRDTVNGWDVLGHKDGDFYVTVQVRPDGEGSRGDVGIVRVPPPGTRPQPIGEGFARPSATTVVNDISYPDDPHNVRTLAMVNRLSVAQNISWYREHMAATGWRPAQANTCGDTVAGCMLAYEKGASTTMITVTPGNGLSNIVANITEEK
ncbi:hypothetical protein [Luteibacter yeojuensis]|uniref:Uncharacterized protein n=1 Tax=Luteibacter yeojuensis TaxID=345309 RepID=A0A7X5QRE0_9GAMM|nr:hypothetical protein [Luteibacter yeojuensis]NID13989.1 hypothetical protein [Luteibacter yeojuensis]